ncbi:MAG: hypothetical protein Q8O57_02705, partial [Kiritimatiellota bacterium]|nr:hypothetical protein [Kiritimatiellota bacterium]
MNPATGTGGLTSASQSFYNLTISPSSGAAITANDSVSVTNNMAVNSGTFSFTQGNTATLTVTGTLTVASGGTITCPYTSLTVPDTGGSGRTITAASIDIQTGGTISADGKGFPEGQGPGSGLYKAGAYGGEGEPTGPTTYGSIKNPLSLGSGGRDPSGAGAIVLSVSGTLTVDGVLSATGLFGTCGSSGGSINIVCNTLSGSGYIKANGGPWNNGYGGGGGRVAIRQTTGTSWTPNIQAFGGTGPTWANYTGAAGTVYLADANDYDPVLEIYKGELIIN